MHGRTGKYQPGPTARDHPRRLRSQGASPAPSSRGRRRDQDCFPCFLRLPAPVRQACLPATRHLTSSWRDRLSAGRPPTRRREATPLQSPLPRIFHDLALTHAAQGRRLATDRERQYRRRSWLLCGTALTWPAAVGDISAPRDTLLSALERPAGHLDRLRCPPYTCAMRVPRIACGPNGKIGSAALSCPALREQAGAAQRPMRRRGELAFEPLHESCRRET